jgi:tRNA-dihydrouridine synthase 3
MAVAAQILKGQNSEWALLRRHPSEDIFGVQIAGCHPEALTKCCEVLGKECAVDFVDINMGCPIDSVCKRGSGAALTQRKDRMEKVVKAASMVLPCMLTVKVRRGFHDKQDTVQTYVPRLKEWGASYVTLHGRSRYSSSPTCFTQIWKRFLPPLRLHFTVHIF